MPDRNKTNLNPFSGDFYVREIELVCDMHRIPCGSPENLAGFVHALDDNKHLAMDFWSLVARMSDVEGPVSSKRAGETGTGIATDHVSERQALNERLLEKIIEAVAGQTVADVVAEGDNARRSVTDLASLLAGEDVYAPAASPWSAPPTKATTGDPLPVAPLLSFAEMKRTADEEADPELLQPEVELVSDLVTDTPKEMPASEGIGPIRRLDEYRRSVVRSELPPVGKLVRAKASYEKQPPATRAKTQDDEVRPPSVPMLAYEESGKKPENLRFVQWLLVVIVTVGVGVFTTRHGIDLWKQFTSGLQILRGGSVQPAGDKAVPTPVPSARAAVPSARAAVPSARAAVPSARAAVPSSIAVEHAAPPIVDRKQPENRDSFLSKPWNGGAMSVPHNVMQAHLISSRTPIYPEIARQKGIKGRVILQVIVSKDGTVGHLRVVAGTPVLRNAALQAVAKWKYRPYLLHGEPVNVSTLVTVDLPPTR